jgi:hypothetical protein
MVEPKLKLKVVQKGTHVLPVSEWNNDVPNPASVVAETLADLEYRIAELVRVGGVMNSNDDFDAVNQIHAGIDNLNEALQAAAEQNWKLELELNPNVA